MSYDTSLGEQSTPYKALDVEPVSSPQALAACFRKAYPKRLPLVERFYVLAVDAACRPLGKPLLVSQGDNRGCDAPPSAIMRLVLSEPLACAFAVCHNHPSGDTMPSTADAAVTQRLVAAGKLLDLPLHDHIILGCSKAAGERWVSLRQTNPSLFS
jgi:DNA repair protein RadC